MQLVKVRMVGQVASVIKPHLQISKHRSIMFWHAWIQAEEKGDLPLLFPLCFALDLSMS